MFSRKQLPCGFLQASSTSEIVELTAEDTTLLDSIRGAHQSTFPMPDQVEVVDEVREEERLGLWDKIEELSLQGVKRIVNFAKRLPDFQEMRQNDQALLLRSAIMELVVSVPFPRSPPSLLSRSSPFASAPAAAPNVESLRHRK